MHAVEKRENETMASFSLVDSMLQARVGVMRGRRSKRTGGEEPVKEEILET